MIRAGRILRSRDVSFNRLYVASYSEESRSMVLFKRASAVLAAAILVCVMSSNLCLGAKANISKVSVPKNMVQGSALTTGRSFYKTNIPEDSLAGIKLGRKATDILSKWGNPSRITVGSIQSEVAKVPSTQAGVPYIPSGNDPYASLSNSLNNAVNVMGGNGSSIQKLPSFGPDGGQPVPGPDSSNTGGSTAMLTQEEVTWTYDLPSGITLEFIITDSYITQITVGGVGPWGLSKTRTGLQLGDTYKLVLWVAGYPESQKYVGRFLRLSYVEKNRALYTLLNNKIVGITIAMVPQEMKQ